MSIVQSGSVTPGNIAIFATDNVIKDGGPLARGEKVLARQLSANFNDTGDQPLILPALVTAFMLTRIIITNASTLLTLAVGGFYPAVAKGGTAIVAAGQVYSSLTTAADLLQATLAAAVATTRYSSANLTVGSNGGLELFLSLTTAQGVAATADVYLVGIDLSP